MFWNKKKEDDVVNNPPIKPDDQNEKDDVTPGEYDYPISTVPTFRPLTQIEVSLTEAELIRDCISQENETRASSSLIRTQRVFDGIDVINNKLNSNNIALAESDDESRTHVVTLDKVYIDDIAKYSMSELELIKNHFADKGFVANIRYGAITHPYVEILVKDSEVQ